MCQISNSAAQFCLACLGKFNTYLQCSHVKNNISRDVFTALTLQGTWFCKRGRLVGGDWFGLPGGDRCLGLTNSDEFLGFCKSGYGNCFGTWFGDRTEWLGLTILMRDYGWQLG